jgi:cytidine deaminase
MIKKELITIYKEFNSEAEFSEKDRELIKKAKDSALNAYAPYSEFKVGASLILNNGKIFAGNNQENAAYPSGLCAERVAVFYANAQYPDIAVSTMAICAINKNGLLKTPVTPCGACRQVLLETELRFNFPIKLILIGSNKLIVLDSITHLMPLHFKKDYLEE